MSNIPNFGKALAGLALLLAGLGAPPSAWAWGAGGHMMVAYLAQARLNAHAKQEADKLLAVPLEPAAAWQKTRDFVSASVWADEVKRQPGYAFSPPLHFIDYPFSPDRTPLPAGLPADDNIVKALGDYLAVLKTGTDPVERAKALRFLIHFVGDIHQPLHCASRVTKNRPGGDKGGNDIEIVDTSKSVHGRKVNLHSYWDEGIETFPKSGPDFALPPLNQIAAAARQAATAYKDSDPDWQAGGPSAFEGWAKESSALAQSTVYPGIVENRAPSKTYVNRAIRLARHQVAWGGYRLAALLNAIWP
jgi:hypothetical protein